MRIFIDTNLFVYVLLGSDEHERCYEELVSDYSLVTDVLVLDELVWVSKRKYSVPYSISLDFIDNLILPFVNVLQLGEGSWKRARDLMLKYNLKPSDALHVGLMMEEGIEIIVSEDKEFDKVEGVRRKVQSTIRVVSQS
ncbi:twitching motility protein PilT [Ignicoccus pacificus DSM 13166]|uniref:Ribonuclease VapC n=1 Tax=Ignicoccus pacificus DSM 13166 TaxID=940294 RepID=A0A977KA68_9CREN|nr:twitching motility protein PilT [Ignicoccus pacificus DSM 13166]